MDSGVLILGIVIAITIILFMSNRVRLDLAAVLASEVPLSAGLQNAQRETRRYAKRQATWLRGQMADWPRLDAVAHEDQWRQFIALHPALTG